MILPIPFLNASGNLYLTEFANANVNISAVPLTDSTGKKVLVTVEDSQFMSLAFEKTSDTDYVFQGYQPSAASSLRTQVSFVPDPSSPDGDYRIDPFYSMVSEGSSDVSDTPCASVGASRMLRDEVLFSGIRLRREELCYPAFWSATGYRRIVLPVVKPQTAPDSKVQDALSAILKGPNDSNLGRIAQHPLVALAKDRLPETNCHGYAVLATSLKAARLLPDRATWIDGMSSIDDEGTHPFQTILHENYKLVKRFQNEDGTGLSHASGIKAGDLLTFVMDGNYVHSGVLINSPRGSGLWLESKAEEGPVVDTPIENASEPYSFTVVEVYREKR
jgi:hypothetical protein